jgi:hypothetical protein
MPKVTYPTRCQIVDPDGMPIAEGLTSRAPEKSLPHIHKKGWAYLVEDPDVPWHTVRIELDDGNVLFGNECFWIPLRPEDEV